MTIKQGDFLFHPELGVGLVQEIYSGKKADIKVDFLKKKNSIISDFSAKKHCHLLNPEGFHAFYFKNRVQAESDVHDNPVEVIKRVLRDFPDYCAKTDQINAYLQPYVDNWKNWWKNTQILMKQDLYIDSSKSKEKNYRLREEGISRTKELLINFRNGKKFGSLEESFNNAKKIVLSYIKIRGIGDEELEEVVSFLRDLVQMQTVGLNIQLNALFRLSDLKLSSEVEINAGIKKFLDSEIRLFSLDTFVQNKLFDILINIEPKDERTITTILDGISGSSNVSEKTGKWLCRQSNSEWMIRAISSSFDEYLPSKLEKPKENNLKTRFTWIKNLIQELPLNIQGWKTISGSLIDFSRKLNKSPEVFLSKYFPFNYLVDIYLAILEKTQKNHPEIFKNIVLCITDLNNQSRWHMQIIESLPGNFFDCDLSKAIRKLISGQIINEMNRKILILWFLESSSDDIKKSSQYICEVVEEYPTKSVISLGSYRLIELCNSTKESKGFINLIPALDYFCNLKNGNQYIQQIHAFRAKAYGLLYELIFIYKEDSDKYLSIIDKEMVNVLSDLLDKENRIQKETADNHKNNLLLTEDKLSNLQKQLQERSRALEEINGGPSLSEKNIKYEERFRILKEFTRALSEIERFIINNNVKSEHFAGLFLRFDNILKSFGVRKRGSINEKIKFDPDFCHIVEGTIPDQSDDVDVISSGYMIEGPDKKIRVLIPTVVKKK